MTPPRTPERLGAVAVIAIVVGLTAWASTSRSAASSVPPSLSGAATDTRRPERPTVTRPLPVGPPVRVAQPSVGSSPAPRREARSVAAPPSPAVVMPAAAGISGVATWFRSPSGVSAAGPALRSALGPGWRGTSVRVCHADRCIVTVLGDTMAADRLIDLHAPLFARLAPLSRGVLRVTLTVIPGPPATATEP